MNYWRISFRIGNQGPEMWPECFTRGIAALSYYHDGEPVVGDCRLISEDEYNEIWKRKRPKAIPARISLRNLAYVMKEKDIIYVKNGPYIVGKGKVIREYQFDPDILKGAKAEWEHYVEVDWQNDFNEFQLILGPEQYTLLKLNNKYLRRIRNKESEAKKVRREFVVFEGKIKSKESKFRERNRGLIAVKKSLSDYRCEVCRMNFKEKYGHIGENYIIAHHLNPIGARSRTSKTTLDDIALVCSNCHDMLHRKNPPFTIDQLKRRLK